MALNMLSAAERFAHVRHELAELQGEHRPAHIFGQHKGVNMSVEVSDTFMFHSAETMTKAEEGDFGPESDIYIYSRSFNPTVEELGRYMAALEGTESAYCTASGMSAITATLIYLCEAGGHVVAADAIYGGTHFLLSNFLPEKCGITTTFVDITNPKEVEEALKSKKTAVLYMESVSNPALIVADIPILSKLAHENGATVVVDNTITPMIITPAKFGADIVLHSVTKYVSGGSDIIGGAICGTEEVIRAITNFKNGALMMLGPVMNPKEAFELVGRMAHLGIRMKKHCNRALKLGKRMETELNIKVIYPGLESHPDHELMMKLQNKGFGFGGILCIDVGSTEKAFKLLENLRKKKFGFMAVSMGYYENLISCPGATVNDETPKKRGEITPGYIRFSVGYIDTLDQKWNQFKAAYEELGQ